MSSGVNNLLIKVKYKNLNGKVLINRKLRGAHIIIGIPCNSLDSFVLSSMKNKICDEDKGILYKHTELTALFYAIYGEIESKLKVPSETVGSSLHDVYCSYVNNYFNLVFVTTTGTGSAVRKILNTAFKSINPAKAWKIYDLILRSMGLKPSKEEFKWCVNQVNECLKKELIVLIVGKINYGKNNTIRTDKLKQTLTSIHKKLKIDKAIAGTQKPESLKNTRYIIPSTLDAVTVSGMSAYYLQKYIGFISRNSINNQLIGNKLVLYTHKNKSWIVAEIKKPTLDNYIKQRYAKKNTIPALTGLVLIDAAISGVVDAKTLFTLADKNLTSNDIKQGIRSSIKN